MQKRFKQHSNTTYHQFTRFESFPQIQTNQATRGNGFPQRNQQENGKLSNQVAIHTHTPHLHLEELEISLPQVKESL